MGAWRYLADIFNLTRKDVQFTFSAYNESIMVLTTTAIGFILLAVGVAVLGWQFLRAFQKGQAINDNKKIGKLLGFLFTNVSLQNGVLGLGALFFAHNSYALYLTTLISDTLLSVSALLGIYVLYYVFLPNASSRFALVGTGLLAVISVISAVTTHPNPFLTADNGIDWNMSFSFSLITFYLLLISLGTVFYIFWELFLKIKALKIRILALTVAACNLVGIINVFIRLVLFYNAPGAEITNLFDIGAGLIGALFILGLIVIPVTLEFRSKCPKL